MPDELAQYFAAVLQDAPAVALLGWLVHRELSALRTAITAVADRVAELAEVDQMIRGDVDDITERVEALETDHHG